MVILMVDLYMEDLEYQDNCIFVSDSTVYAKQYALLSDCFNALCYRDQELRVSQVDSTPCMNPYITD
ncbi:hypothetical protein An07g04890 [Aspergillus niger]|uniref:Uncharacterized protein n=2 Tax=Aspergillus niger TaxID=5061 RepID=A2QN99_ASPNC|nr:hypothetical protein An07g04890 [Aspergillus niger]CAK39408.1 hypothetical protein An07g04890 [Aspergillus niger]